MQERLKLIIAYDGRPFCGWQSQAGGGSIQDFIEGAFQKILNTETRVHGSGRTDAGVHALRQIAHVDVPESMHSMAVWKNALNANLPHEIRILHVSQVKGGDEGFHARFDATGKRYVYRIWNDLWMHPLEIGRAWHVPSKLDLSALRSAAVMLLGKHDFANFTANRGNDVEDTVRTISRLDAIKRCRSIHLIFEGDGFLYKMVRMLTGTLIRVAEHKMELAELNQLLQPSASKKTQFTAPAEGLYLARVFYK
jgi:tRNA pseudouridine38-40 synthase